MSSSRSHSFAESKADTGSTRTFLRLADVAEVLGVSTSTVYRMAHRAELPVVRRAGGMFVPRVALAAYLAAEAEIALENLNGPGAADEAPNKEAGVVTKH